MGRLIEFEIWLSSEKKHHYNLKQYDFSRTLYIQIDIQYAFKGSLYVQKKGRVRERIDNQVSLHGKPPRFHVYLIETRIIRQSLRKQQRSNTLPQI